MAPRIASPRTIQTRSKPHAKVLSPKKTPKIPVQKRRSTSKRLKSRDAPEEPPFPFERLPMELQANVLRFAMPRRLLLTQTPYPYEMSTMHKSTAISLLRVSKAVSAIAEYILKNETYLVIDFDFSGWHVGFWEGKDSCGLRLLDHQSMFDSDGFPCPPVLADIHQLRGMRRFEVNFMTSPISIIDAFFYLPEYLTPESECREKLRLICDTLAAFNDNLQHLIVRVPCTCHLENPEIARFAISWVVELLSPLRRLRVAKAVTFHIEHSHLQLFGKTATQNDAQTEQQLQILQTSLGRLTGEKLTEQEELWKSLKAMDWPASPGAMLHLQVEFRMILAALNRGGDDFESKAKQAKVYICRHLRQEKSQEWAAQWQHDHNVQDTIQP
ncbi:MAG: hypothetical protein Q9222_002788 [Ikaeria aurantiellina]